MAHAQGNAVHNGLRQPVTHNQVASHTSGQAAGQLAGPDRQALERRVALIDRRLDSIQQGQLSQMMEWRELLLEKERLQNKLANGD